MPRRMGKAVVHIPKMADYMARRAQLSQQEVLNPKAHEILHGTNTLVYQTATTLDTTAGPKIVPPRGGQITQLRCKLQGAPSGSNFQVDFLIDDISVFGGGYLEVVTGQTLSYTKVIERPYFNPDSVFKVKINAINSATGPMVMTIEYLPEY